MNKQQLDNLMSIHRSYSLTKAGKKRKRRDFCLMFPFVLLQAAMNTQTVVSAIKAADSTTKHSVKGLVWRYQNYQKNATAGQDEVLLSMEQLDWLVAQIQNKGCFDAYKN